MFRNVSKGGSNNFSSGGGYRGRGRGGRGSYSKRPQGDRQQPRGLFADGIWQCDCDPRLPAEHFKVKKEGKNQGRWFYTCQNGEGRRCGFFLWDEDAKPRMEAAVLNNSRTEPRSTPGVLPSNLDNATTTPSRPAPVVIDDRSPTMSPEPPPPYSSQSNSSATLGRDSGTSAKRSAAEANLDLDLDGDEFFPWPLTGQEEQEMARVADRASHQPETPRKAVKTTDYATPATTAKRKLPWLDYSSEDSEKVMAAKPPETPSKSAAVASMPTPSLTKPQDTHANITPSHSRFFDAMADGSSSSTTLADEVFAALRSASISLTLDLANQVRGILNKHEMRTQGIAKGRDISRLALKAKDAKIVELQARIASLEAERELDRVRIRGLKLKDGTLDRFGSA